MNIRLAALLLSISATLARGSQNVEVQFTSHDGYPMFGKLTLPDTESPSAVVVYVQAAEAMTIDMKRPLGAGRTFNYFDLYREKLPAMNVGFFSYEGRGVRMGDSPPRYEQIDAKVYNTSTLENKVLDLLSAVRIVRQQKGVDPSRIFVMGASEGTYLAAEAASRAPEEIHGLILYGVLSTTLKDMLRYMAGDGAMLSINAIFDTNKDGSISKDEFAVDAARRRAGLTGVTFEDLDADANGMFTSADFKQLRKSILDSIDGEQFEAIYAWLKLTAAVSIPDKWLEDHFAHAPMWTFLSKLTIPVGFFHGNADANTPIDGTKALEARAEAAGIANFEFYYFDGLDHSLGVGQYFAGRPVPAGHQAIFDFIQRKAGAR